MTTQPTTEPIFDLSGRTAIVTGGSRGLGRAIALGYATAGARVVIASRKSDACESVADEIRDGGGDALAVATHIGRPDDIEALVATTVAWSGAIDIVVNNAANPIGGALAEVTPLAFEKAYGANVLGPLLLCNAALPYLTESAHASIINVITVGAFRGGEYLGLYCSSKAALWNLTGVMSKEWARHAIRVNAISPGPFDTAMMAPTLDVPEFRRSIEAAAVQHRIAQPVEIVGAALLLASDAGSYMTGSCITVDGGTMA